MFSLYTPSARLNAIGLTAVALITLGATAPAVQAQTSAHGIQEALEPGTVMSGLMRPSAVGPQLLKDAIELALAARRVPTLLVAICLPMRLDH